MGEFSDKWAQELNVAKNDTSVPFGNIDWEYHGPAIILEAAKIKGVSPPEADSDEYAELLLEIRYIAEHENDELMNDTGRW
jgi:hypothetical protein